MSVLGVSHRTFARYSLPDVIRSKVLKLMVKEGWFDTNVLKGLKRVLSKKYYGDGRKEKITVRKGHFMNEKEWMLEWEFIKASSESSDEEDSPESSNEEDGSNSSDEEDSSDSSDEEHDE
jgi:hypothetical protein